MNITYADLESLAGQGLGASEWLVITQDQISTFAEVTNDHYWLHTDVARAATSPFGGTISHGFLTLAMISALWPKLLWVTDSPMQMNAGFDRMRFTAPVPSGTRIRLAATLLEVAPSKAGLRITVDMTMEREHQDRPAFVATMLMDIARPDGSAGHGDPNR